ncbi:psbQ-like protein 3, chloroplastic [Dioscorea cayenensis subsp. rotundata]|uniref:PsbQ-like protein 3, chloroplastic n=1 Tax=Dioscorea cayennensis subsp. rotundata TaxID=55577 RepID=A0AB40CDF9_DIOCR|nr:psbQ-like protein 3, chloroplastic [Dioscorea cayenensis subsp. rotundata]
MWMRIDKQNHSKIYSRKQMLSPMALISSSSGFFVFPANSKPFKAPHEFQIRFSRRTATTATVLLVNEAFSYSNKALSFELQFTVPDQTPEEAYAGIRSHAQDLLQIKVLIDLQSWKEAQKELRRSSAYLKQDLYTVIQSRPGSERPLLRKLYSNLFNNVSRLDYAARSKDAAVVQECYDNIVTAIDEIFARI